MRIYWYWPWPAERSERLAQGALRAGADDQLLVQCLDDARDASVQTAVRGPVHLAPNLPSPSPREEHTPRWALDRLGLLLLRVWRRRRAVRAFRPDVIHLHVPNHLIDPFTMRLLRRTAPLVTSVHDIEPHHRRLPSPIERQFLRRLYRDAGELIVYHQYLRERLVRDYCVPAERITVVHHPIRSESRSTPYGESPGTPMVLFFGALRRNKGLGVLLEAVDLIEVPAQVLIAGGGTSALERLVEERSSTDDRVSAEIGFATNERRSTLYEDAALVVLPYTSFESQSGVLADAYAMGVPVVGTDVGALGETIDQDGVGWVARAGDPADLARVISLALRDAEGRRVISERMQRLATERTEQTVGSQFRDVYDRAVRVQTRPRQAV